MGEELDRQASEGHYVAAFQKALAVAQSSDLGRNAAKSRLQPLRVASEIQTTLDESFRGNELIKAKTLIQRLHAEFGLSDQKAQEMTTAIDDKLSSFLSKEFPPGTEKTISLPGGETMTFCWCPATTDWHWKCTNNGDAFYSRALPGTKDRTLRQHICLTHGFWIGKTPVTQEQWASVMGNNPSYFKHTGDNPILVGSNSVPCNQQHPVEFVSWIDVQHFLKKLRSSVGNNLTARLPTDAEWEYACRAGGEDNSVLLKDGRTASLEDIAWYSNNAGKHTQPVGLKQPNAWGLFDILGNVSEWCTDSSPATSPVATDPFRYSESSSLRVYRGGAWNSGRIVLDVRATDGKKRNSPSRGFRVVLGFNVPITEHDVPKKLVVNDDEKTKNHPSSAFRVPSLMRRIGGPSVKNASNSKTMTNAAAEKKLSRFAQWAFCFGALSIFCVGAPFAIWFGVRTLCDIKNHPNLEGKGRGVFGIISGSSVLLLWLLGYLADK